MSFAPLSRPAALAVALTLAISGAALAQETAPATDPATAAPAATAPAAEAPATEAPATAVPAATPAAPPADGPGSIYLAATEGDWERRCLRVEAGQTEPCQLFQLLKDDTGNPTAQIVLFRLPEGAEAQALAEITVPLETLLTAGLEVQIDTNKPGTFPFTYCDPLGCVARIGFGAPEIDAFKKGSAAKLGIVPVLAADKKVPLTISLKGFTASYDALPVPAKPAN